MAHRSDPNSSDIFRQSAIMTFAMPDEEDEHDSDHDLRRLLELACDWCWTLDSELRLIRLRGRPLDDGPNFMHAQLGKRPWEWSGIVADTPEFIHLRQSMLTHASFYELSCVMRDAHGSTRHQVLSGEPLFEHGRFVGFHGTTRDLTRQRRTEALVTLEHAVTRSLSAAATSRQVLQAVMKVICEAERWGTAGFFRTEDETGTTRLIAGWSGPGMADAALAYYQQNSDKVIPSTGMLAKVVATREPIWISDLKTSQTSWSQRIESTRERATLFFPVTLGERVVGVFAFASGEVREPDERLLETLRVVGEQVGQFLKRKEAEQVLRESEARFRALTQLSSDWYWEMDANLCLTRIEVRDVDDDEGLPGKRSIGKPMWDLGLDIDGSDWKRFRARLEDRLQLRDVEMMHARPDGSRRSLSISGEPMFGPGEVFLGYRGVGRDISERKAAEMRIQHMATHDGLTGLPNRILFHELLTAAVRLSTNTQRMLAVLFVDLDRFKNINDTFGHDAGDLLLQQTGRRLSECLRTSDVVARLGGDEFVVLLQQNDCEQDVADIASKILVAISQPIHLGSASLGVTASIGISLFGVDSHDEHALLKHADLAMYVAKQQGRNAYRFHSPDARPIAAPDASDRSGH
jgi:diguanylate cyclase (GGDEF)-like protein/PAS domain S-box-containing protein